MHNCQTRVKAIFIYPMNALASDQARRIAKLINDTSSLRGKVTAGLYVGETGASPGTHLTADHLIENRDVLRAQPPDILLTNYKMLDLLLTRPVDFPLWRHNTSGVLRYLVVDELHTFDGAQGTDLACLIRRLRARLHASDGLVCIGTSATIGGAGDQPAVVDYVSSVFHQRFSSDAVIGEVRQGIDEFLEDSMSQPNSFTSTQARSTCVLSHEVATGSVHPKAQPAPDQPSYSGSSTMAPWCGPEGNTCAWQWCMPHELHWWPRWSNPSRRPCAVHWLMSTPSGTTLVV